ncbi:hypothetical protein ACSSS7_004184 [Eimeria intestinalis]
MFGEEGTVFDSFGPIRSTWASVLHFHTLPFGVYLFALAALTAEVVAARIEAAPAEVQQRLFEVLRGREGEDRGLNPGLQEEPSRTEGIGESRRKTHATATAAAAAARKTAVSFNSERRREEQETKGDSFWQGEEREDEEGDGSLVQIEDESGETDFEDDPRDLENEPLLFSQVFESLGLNPQDVQLWANALKRHLGDLLTEAEDLRRKLSLFLLNKATVSASTEKSNPH